MSGTLTITTATAQPYLRVGATGSISVDLYDASMTLLASSIKLTRVNDSEFTTPHSALATAAWMVTAGVNWTKNDSTSKRTGVHLDWIV